MDPDILNQFSGEEQEEVNRLWNLARRRESLTAPADHVDLDAEWYRLRSYVQNKKSRSANEVGRADNVGKTEEAVKVEEVGKAEGSGVAAGLKTASIGKKTVSRSTQKIQPSRKREHVLRTYAFIFSLAALLLGGFILWYLFVPVSVQAPRGEYVSYEWSDGVRVELNSGSTITWNRSFGNGHNNLQLHGEAYFEVPSTGNPFVVQTTSARIEVLGTRFNVRSWSDDPDKRTTLTLIDGEVSLASLKQPEHHIVLPPGHSSQVDIHNSSPHDPEPVDTDQALAWRDYGFYFSAITMSEVASELERRYDTNITIENESLSRRTLTVFLPRPGDLENIVESICFVTDCRYSQENGHIFIY